MAVSYGNVHVDEKYARILEPNLFANSIFAPGQTYTDKYEEGPAGGIFVHKLYSTACTPGTPGRDFSDETASDSLIQIVLNNNFQKSKKIYGVQAAAVDMNLADEELSLAVAEVAEGFNQAGLACLVAEGTTATSTASVTSSSIKKEVIKARKEIVAEGGSPDVLICSPETFSLILEAAGSEYIPQSNEYINKNGQVGQWLGMTVIEASGLAKSSATYYNAAGTLTTSSFSGVDFICYKAEAFSAVKNFDVARIIDSESFAGSKAQVEMNVGYKVTNDKLCVVKTH